MLGGEAGRIDPVGDGHAQSQFSLALYVGERAEQSEIVARAVDPRESQSIRLVNGEFESGLVLERRRRRKLGLHQTNGRFFLEPSGGFAIAVVNDFASGGIGCVAGNPRPAQRRAIDPGGVRHARVEEYRVFAADLIEQFLVELTIGQVRVAVAPALALNPVNPRMPSCVVGDAALHLRHGRGIAQRYVLQVPGAANEVNVAVDESRSEKASVQVDGARLRARQLPYD